ncbi:MAG: hypothetical protein MUF18_16360, partial [Fimbriiglobus sp.]|nr:hypothetical protein [Fimbriiglobus sp.]
MTITKETLRAFLADSLPDAEAAEVEKQVRDDPAVRTLFAEVQAEEDRGEHSVGAIWRRAHISCPSRDQLGGYLLQALDDDLIDYIDFHLTTVGCAYCGANLDDLKQRQAEANAEATKKRRKRIVNSSAGLL